MAARRGEGSGRRLVATIQRVILDDMAMASIRQDLLQRLDGHEVRDVVLNFRKVKYVSSGALGMLITFHQKLNQLGGRLILCNVAAGIAEGNRCQFIFFG
jgi:anti-anti-sigma factor